MRFVRTKRAMATIFYVVDGSKSARGSLCGRRAESWAGISPFRAAIFDSGQSRDVLSRSLRVAGEGAGGRPEPLPHRLDYWPSARTASFSWPILTAFPSMLPLAADAPEEDARNRYSADTAGEARLLAADFLKQLLPALHAFFILGRGHARFRIKQFVAHRLERAAVFQVAEDFRAFRTEQEIRH